MANNEQVPPLASSGVFAVSATSTIDAPTDVVWKNLVGFEAYKEWNPFVRDQKVLDASGNVVSRPPAVGDYLDIRPVHLPPTLDEPWFFNKGSAYAQITVLDHESYRAAWKTASNLPPSWLLRSERWQTLTTLPDGKTRYDNIEVFFGPIAYIVKLVVGANLKLGFQAMADTLKERSERQTREG